MLSAALLAAVLATESTATPDAGHDVLRMVLTPYRTPEELVTRYRGLADRLGTAAGKAVELHVAPDFGSAAEMIVDGRADFGELTPYAFVNGMQKGKLVPLAADAMVGRSGTGLIITRASSSITKLEELRGHQFGFVDRFSSTGFLGPWANLQSKGLDPAKLFTHRFLGSHDAVLEKVHSGEVDAGAVSRHAYDGWLAEHPKDADAFRVLVETSRMPGDVLCASGRLPAATTKALSDALLALDAEKPDDKKVLEPISRKAFVAVDVKDYGWLLRVAASIKK